MNAKLITYNLLALMILMVMMSLATSAQDEEVRKEGWFYSDEHPEIVEALQDSEYTDEVLEALADAGKNWVELWDGIDVMVGQHREDGCWLLAHMPHLDRLEMDKVTLLEHVNYAWVTKSDLSYDTPEELFREYILTYRIGDEPVRPYRAEIWWNYDFLVGDTPSETARNVNEWVFKNIEPRERGFFGPRADPVSIISAGTGTSTDIAVVAIAMCKTFGVAARRARIEVLGEQGGGKTWLEIYSNGEWLPLYPDNPEAFGDFTYVEQGFPRNVTLVRVESAFGHKQVTGNYTGTGELTISFERNGELAPDYEHFTVSAWNNGAWLPIDDIWYGTDEPGEDGFTTVLGNGFYVVQAGVRNARGDAWVQTMPVILNDDDETMVMFELDIPASESSRVELIRRIIEPLPEIGFVSENYKCLMIFDPVGEPSIRMAPVVAEWCTGNDVELIGVGVGDPVTAQALWDGLPTEGIFIEDPYGILTAEFGITPNNEEVWHRLPLVILFSPYMEIILLQEGLNLSIEELIPRAIELYESE